MKTRHFAALALIGWYLIVPLQTRTWWIGPQRYDDSAPLSRWAIDRSFDKAGGCEAARQATEQQSGDAAIRMEHSVCIASDDPRLRTSF
jgi:hypothetical protein